MPPATLNELFFGAMDRNGSRPVAMRCKQNDQWQEISFAETRERVQCIAAGLMNSVWLASSAPARPARAGASRFATSPK